MGGTLITSSSLIKGFEILGLSSQILFLVRAHTIMEDYFTTQGQESYFISIKSSTQKDFFGKALQWVNKQPTSWPLFLDNTVAKALLPTLFMSSLRLRFSNRNVYHFFHDLALSYRPLGFVFRKIIFTLLSPKSICNSYFTSEYINNLVPERVGEILYQPVDLERFSAQSFSMVPEGLKPILENGSRIILTPSRITKPGIINDKNLRALIPVLKILKSQENHYHLVIIGEDNTQEKTFVQQLLAQAQEAGVANSLTILPPVFNIEDYYQHADIVLTLAPREPFGRIVVEALACGIPVIGSNTGGIGEILNNFSPNWAVFPDNPDAVAKAVMATIDDPETPAILLDAQQWIRENCSVLHYADAIRKIVGF